MVKSSLFRAAAATSPRAKWGKFRPTASGALRIVSGPHKRQSHHSCSLRQRSAACGANEAALGSHVIISPWSPSRLLDRMRLHGQDHRAGEHLPVFLKVETQETQRDTTAQPRL